MLRAIKEEQSPVKSGRSKTVGGGVRDDDGAVMNDSTRYARRKEVETILRRKFILSGGTRRTRRRVRKRANQGRRVKRVRWFGRCNTAGQTVADIIRLFSCSASRYAMFWSNKRFKPGDSLDGLSYFT